jgi:hypothetical protein
MNTSLHAAKFSKMKGATVSVFCSHLLEQGVSYRTSILFRRSHSPS